MKEEGARVKGVPDGGSSLPQSLDLRGYMGCLVPQISSRWLGQWLGSRRCGEAEPRRAAEKGLAGLHRDVLGPDPQDDPWE